MATADLGPTESGVQADSLPPHSVTALTASRRGGQVTGIGAVLVGAALWFDLVSADEDEDAHDDVDEDGDPYLGVLVLTPGDDRGPRSGWRSRNRRAGPS